MSDQQETGAGVILDLEELFLSREFGRRPMHRTSPAMAAVESASAQLEQVFLSEVFGHPEVVMAATRVVEESAPAVSGWPGLVLLKGGGEGAVERDNAHYRAIAAVSGVAAAALAVAGLNSGTAPRPGRPPITEQAQGVPLTTGTPGSGASSPGPAGPVAQLSLPALSGAPGAISGTSGGGATFAQITSVVTPAAAPIPQGTAAGGAAPSAPTPTAPTTPSGGSPPGIPTGGDGGGSTLAPAVQVIGNEVSSVGSAVTTTSGDLGQALPMSSVTSALGTLATSAVNNLGGGSPPQILASALKQ
ncbi:MAG TPA: hypothetical protein VNV83_05310 [Acidimicrobiales bacterium]|jgi:hypothetical protein|nr:hypothetical protein [Acidimicrobiales bacterium]